MRNLLKYSFLFTILALITSCGNREVLQSQVEYDNENQIILFEDKPFTGKVLGEGEFANSYAIIENGKIIDVVETIKKANGYKEVRHKDNSTEYYDYNGNRISKPEYESNNE